MASGHLRCGRIDRVNVINHLQSAAPEQFLLAFEGPVCNVWLRLTPRLRFEMPHTKVPMAQGQICLGLLEQLIDLARFGLLGQGRSELIRPDGVVGCFDATVGIEIGLDRVAIERQSEVVGPDGVVSRINPRIAISIAGQNGKAIACLRYGLNPIGTYVEKRRPRTVLQTSRWPLLYRALHPRTQSILLADMCFRRLRRPNR